MWRPDICVYHGGCDDGFGAAWAIWKRWPDCRFIPGFYGKELSVDEFAGRNVLFVDFSAKRDALEGMGRSARSIVILDHHKTAEAELAPFREDYSDRTDGLTGMPEELPGLFGGRWDRLPVIAFFDMQVSGAVMAWEFAHGIKRNDPPPRFLAYIQDRDLWRHAFGDRTRQFSAALRTYPMEFELWDRLAQDPDALIPEGEIVLRAHQSNLRKIIAEAYTTDIGGHAVPVVNAPYHYASDAAHELLIANPGAPFAACWFQRADGKRQWSLRSEDNRVDVSSIAKMFGGGGHRNSAGFETSAP